MIVVHIKLVQGRGMGKLKQEFGESLLQSNSTFICLSINVPLKNNNQSPGSLCEVVERKFLANC